MNAGMRIRYSYKDEEKCMVSTIGKIIEDMENGFYNFTDNGRCIGCGQCCSSLLPISEKDLRRLHRYVDKKHIKPVPRPFAQNAIFDLTCPFLDTTKSDKKCMVYPYRPEICMKFKCDKPSNEKDKTKFHSLYKVVDLWQEFYERPSVDIQKRM